MVAARSAAKQGKVLVLDTNKQRVADLSSRLRFLNYEPVTPQSLDDLDLLSDSSEIAVMLGDMDAGQGICRALRELSLNRPGLPVMRIAGSHTSAGVDSELSTLDVWNLDFPLKRAQLTHLLRRAERFRGQERRARLTGNSKSICSVRKLIEQVSDFDTSVLITGESGTGKELVARTIHDLSGRSDMPFVPINCGAIPLELLESELFGHEKGAFTGAIAARKGRFELAEGGTLFLDEIGEMSMPMQVKLLRVIQERSYERVGSSKNKKCNVRIISATHRDLPLAVSKKEFREDLFYRLNVFPIRMPRLCKRASDLPPLLDELLIQYQDEGKERLRLSEDAMQALSNYSWPGNIRELSNLVERLAILKPSGEVSLADLPKKYREAQTGSGPQDQPSGDNKTFTNINLKAHLQKVEIELIKKAMRESAGVVAKAARLLNLRRTTLVEKLSKYDL